MEKFAYIDKSGIMHIVEKREKAFAIWRDNDTIRSAHTEIPSQ